MSIVYNNSVWLEVRAVVKADCSREIVRLGQAHLPCPTLDELRAAFRRG